MKKKGTIVKGKDLEAGMLTTEGFIYHVDLTDDDSFWEKPYIRYFQKGEAYYGGLDRALDLESEHEILYEKGSDEYVEYLKGVINDREERINDAKSDIGILKAYIFFAKGWHN